MSKTEEEITVEKNSQRGTQYVLAEIGERYYDAQGPENLSKIYSLRLAIARSFEAQVQRSSGHSLPLSEHIKSAEVALKGVVGGSWEEMKDFLGMESTAAMLAVNEHSYRALINLKRSLS